MSAADSVPNQRIRQAGADDAEAFAQLLDAAGQWLAARGIAQWPASFERPPLAAAAARGELWLLEQDGVLAGGLMLQWADEGIWGAQPPDAGYVHKLVVARPFAGQGLGRAMLDWAAAQVVAAGRAFLRLDCWAGNVRLRDFYRAAGFEHCGDVAEAAWQVSLWQRRLGRP